MTLARPDYSLLDSPGGGLLLTEHPVHGRQVWTLVKLKTRRGANCARCHRPLGPSAYRPVTNRNNRMERICERCVTGKRP